MSQAESISELTAEIVSAYVSNNQCSTAELPAIMRAVYLSLSTTGEKAAAPAKSAFLVTPAQIRKSISHDALISFEDGKPYRSLKRHLWTHGLTPNAYRAKWHLPEDYPMVASGYSETRSALARKMGLGRKVDATAPAKVAPDHKNVSGRAKKAKT